MTLFVQLAFSNDASLFWLFIPLIHPPVFKQGKIKLVGLPKGGASSRIFVYTLSLAIKPKKSGKFKNHATYTISIW